VPASRSEKSSQKTAPAKSQKITTAGLGATPSEAEKQALSEAVRQAVGALLDAKTLIENEEVIEDRILTVNNGFVKSYDVVAPAKKSSDGVFEIKISAVIETSIVAQALQDAGIKGEIAGQNLWAESTTKIMNVQDACQMLESKLPELIEKMVLIEFSDAHGRVIDSSQPVKTSDEGDSVSCTWYVKLSIDKAYYFKTTLPIIQKCYEAIAMCKPQEFSFSNPEKDTADISLDEKERYYTNILKKFTFKTKKNGYAGKLDDGKSMFIIKSVSRSADSVSGLIYEKPKNILKFAIGGWAESYLNIGQYTPKGERLNLTLKVYSVAGDLISEASAPVQYGFFYALSATGISRLGPFFNIEPVRDGDWLDVVSEQFIAINVKIPLTELKDAKKVQVVLDKFKIGVHASPR
jgi:hypothetical protein